MKKFLLIAFLIVFVAAVLSLAMFPELLWDVDDAAKKTFDADLEYFKVIVERHPTDPQTIVLTMAHYLSAGQEKAGIDHLSTILTKNEERLQPVHKALYLSAIGLLRARCANRVALVRRIDWVEETIAMLEQAKQLSAGKVFVVRWIAGVVFSQLPQSFAKVDDALADLQWCLENRQQAPEPGWLREAFFGLALVHEAKGESDKAQQYLTASGYAGYDKEISLTTSFTVEKKTGFSFAKRELEQIVKGKIFRLSGFEFTEYYFIVSDDNKHLIAIDAGTRQDSAKDAYEYLRKEFPELPPLTTVLVTHAHWDHIGGYKYFREVHPQVKFYARDNYHKELKNIEVREIMPFHFFFGTAFTIEDIRDFRPDVEIAERQEIQIGETSFELIPISGGETEDALLIHMPKEQITFVGDFIMPYLGAPFVEEGNIEGLFATIDTILSLQPKRLLHGHRALTERYNPPFMLAELNIHLQWLRKETMAAIARGESRTQIHHHNLIPADISEGPVLIAYVVIRENFINRLYDQNSGYWHVDLAGMDHLDEREMGSLLVDYFALSESQLASAIEKMIANGDYELAAKAARWAVARDPQSTRLNAVKKRAFLRLKEKYQSLNPFKFIIYSEMIGDETKPLSDELPVK